MMSQTCTRASGPTRYHPLVRAERPDVRELHVTPVLDVFLENALVGRVIDLVEDRAAVGVARPQSPVIEIESAALVDETHHVGGRFAEGFVEARIGLVELDDETDRLAAPIDDLVDRGAHRIAIGDAQRLVHAARDDAGAVNALSRDVADHFLPELARQHAAPGEIGESRSDSDDVALGDLALEAEQQVRRGEVKEVQRVRLHDLTIMQEAAELLRRRRERPVAGDEVHRLGRGDQVADRADAAQTLHRDRNLPVRPAADEDLEAAKLDDVQPDLMDAILVVEKDRHLAVALDPGDRLDGDAAELVGGLGGFEVEHGAALNRSAADRDRDAACVPGSDR